METKFHSKSIFESGFDSFEFDDGFLMKISSAFKKNKINEKTVQSSPKVAVKLDNVQGEENRKKFDARGTLCDLPLFIEDLDNSDFLELNNKKKVVNSHKNEKSKCCTISSLTNSLSPIQGLKSKKQLNLSTSTPVKPKDISNSKKLGLEEENSAKHSNCDYLEADLFEDWGMNEENRENAQKSTVTLSQAIEMIEEAERARDSAPKEILNQSIDLLTGEVIGADIGVMFEESFGLPKSAHKNAKVLESSTDSVVVLQNCKPPAAQKLNFESEKVDKLAKSSEILIGNICFGSDDDFDFLTQDLLEKPMKVSNCAKSELNLTKDSGAPVCDLDESTEGVVPFKKKRGKRYNVISESDTEEDDSPNPTFCGENNRKKKNSKVNFGREFIESEAEVSDEVEVSSDEEVEDGDYDESFVDEGSYFTQNSSANMTTKYLESVKTANFPGRFKIPAAKPYNPDNVFSQIPEESNADYEIDSFCVNDVEEEAKTELSELEIAEKILEMDRKKKRKKRIQNYRE